jgi:hypothetical protein
VLVVARDARQSTAVEMNAHQRDMRGVRQRVDDERTFECARCAEFVAISQDPAKAYQRIDRPRSKPPALELEPLLKRRFAQCQSVEQCSTIEGRGALQLGGIVGFRGTEKLAHIHVQALGRKTDGVAVGFDRVAPERPPQQCQRLAEAVARLRLGTIAPEQIEDPVTRHAIARGERQHGEQSFGFSRGQYDPAAGGIECLERAEQMDGTLHSRIGIPMCALAPRARHHGTDCRLTPVFERALLDF